MGTAIALGNFDGVHKAHEALVRNTVAYAKAHGLESMAYVFTPHPKFFLCPQTPPALLMTDDMKRERLLEIGIDRVAEENRGIEILSLSPQEFVQDVLAKELDARFVTAGFNYRFGKKASGDAALLQTLCRENGIECEIMDRISIDGTPISSTSLRTLLENGDVETVNARSFAPYTLKGVVQAGKKLGRTIGFPTINIEIPKILLLPKKGVYASLVRIENRVYKGVTNIGQNPTVEQAVPRAETYIFDFSRNIYGETVELTLLKMLRPEQKFSGTETLSAQIRRDAEETMLYFERKDQYATDRTENSMEGK